MIYFLDFKASYTIYMIQNESRVSKLCSWSFKTMWGGNYPTLLETQNFMTPCYFGAPNFISIRSKKANGASLQYSAAPFSHLAGLISLRSIFCLISFWLPLPDRCLCRSRTRYIRQGPWYEDTYTLLFFSLLCRVSGKLLHRPHTSYNTDSQIPRLNHPFCFLLSLLIRIFSVHFDTC